MANQHAHRDDDGLAYGDYHGQPAGAEGERGIIGDVAKHFFGGKAHDKQSDVTQTYQPHLAHQSASQQPASSSGEGGMSFVFDKLHSAVHSIGSELKEKLPGHEESHGQGQPSGPSAQSLQAHGPHADHRFESFAPQRQGNDIKWYVDACGYMWAVSMALERARESIYILDWWLSPELYLRRPPAKFEQYRVDRLLHQAAERGVKVNIIVYKEVTQALTRKYLNPALPEYLHSILPPSTDRVTRFLARVGLWTIFRSLEEVEKTDPLIHPPITVSSAHTKHALEALHPNISVFRHPDHLPDKQVLESSFLSSLQSMTTAKLSQLPGDTLKAIYGMNEDTILYWAHHEKLCLVDKEIAFMGGIDLCYGRWDLNQHPIADAHPGDLDRIVFPGQEFNNARIMDFQNVDQWQNNKLERTKFSRMGWSDLSVSLRGPIVQDLITHFAQRWNFIYNEKYNVRKDVRYTRLALPDPSMGGAPPDQRHGAPPEGTFGGGFRSRIEGEMQRFEPHHQRHHHAEGAPAPQGGVSIQLTRSCAKWSHGVAVEHSIANAYCEVIKNSQHFVYIENQFFITATSDKQKPIKNKIAAAIVERILRAGRNGEKYKMIVVMPAVPAFAGDLRSDEALGTRAIMEFQYNSINRGGSSIYETIAKEGLNPLDYIRFYNLRTYDRINASGAMRAAEQRSGVSYEQAREQYDVDYGCPPPQNYEQKTAPVHEMDAGSGQSAGQGGHSGQSGLDAYQQYQQGASHIGSLQGLGSGRWDTVSECYMLGGTDIRNVPWEGGGMDEMDAFVSEELYVHSKLLIADDRIVICGSANLNDRSQLGNHDSEIAVVIEDPTPVESRMDGQPWRAGQFAASLRRQVLRKHLGLVRPQDMTQPDQNFEPIGVQNTYDWGSPEDQQVVDPLANEFQELWNWRAKANTDAFARVFHPVPFDGVRTWKSYDEYYERFFHKEKDKDGKVKKPSQYLWGHVVAEEFSPGEQGLREVKEVLSSIKGTLVEMPLLFLKEEDIAKEGISLNAFTEDVYT